MARKINTDLKTKLRNHLERVDTPFRKALQFTLLFMNITACVHFVVGTYLESEIFRAWHYKLEVFLVLWFSIEYLLRLYASPSRLRFLFSFYSVVDLLSILPTFFTAGNFAYLRAFRTLRILRFIRYLEDENFFFGNITPTGLLITRVCYTIITLIFISSATIYETEYQAVGTHIRTYTDGLYFTVITLSTVGYGDFTPVTETGRIVTMLMILSGMIFVPWQAGKLLRVIIHFEESKEDILCHQCGLTRHDSDAVHCKMCGTTIFQEYDGV
jgi:voltage-gated potassium channel